MICKSQLSLEMYKFFEYNRVDNIIKNVTWWIPNVKMHKEKNFFFKYQKSIKFKGLGEMIKKIFIL